jgi:hypothetical protein
MAKLFFKLVALATLSQTVMADPVAQPDPMITAAPIFQVKRQAAASNFIGWYPESVVGNTTICKYSETIHSRNQ